MSQLTLAADVRSYFTSSGLVDDALGHGGTAFLPFGDPAMSFHQVNESFERWLADRCMAVGCEVVTADLKRKHERMKKDAFVFLRATFFRWAGTIERLCPDLADTPRALSVGDAHIENFGTWRDDEGRLVWGANDFDEASVISYPFDLVRLAASARLAPKIFMDGPETCAALLKGYQEGLGNPRPTVLDECHAWLRKLVVCPDDKRDKFWKEVDALESVKPPRFVRDALIGALPKDADVVRFATRTAGGGGLGRPRYVAIAEWRGGRVVREAKALVPSAWDWAHRSPNPAPRFAELAAVSTRAPDPYMTVTDGFVVRRLAADSRKAELIVHPDAELPDKVLEELDENDIHLQHKLLHAMGREIGTLHAATADVRAIEMDLNGRDRDWLHTASKNAAKAVKEDFKTWKAPVPPPV